MYPPARPTLLLFGNCQAEALTDALRRLDCITGRYDLRYVCNFDIVTRDPSRQLHGVDLASVILLLEQLDATAPTPDWLTARLPPGTPRLRYLSMDTSLIWPFQALDPRNHPEPGYPYGRYAYGDRIVIQVLKRGLAGEAAFAAYQQESPRHLRNLARHAELDILRLAPREAIAEVGFSDIVTDQLRIRPLFWSYNHPTGWLLQQVASRVLDRLRHLLGLTYDAAQLARAWQDFDPLYHSQIPIHPEVARQLQLDWWSPDRLYRNYDGTALSYNDFMLRYIKFI
jgi:hypothetical protein